jgi:hypothetical protein
MRREEKRGFSAQNRQCAMTYTGCAGEVWAQAQRLSARLFNGFSKMLSSYAAAVSLFTALAALGRQNSNAVPIGAEQRAALRGGTVASLSTPVSGPYKYR